MLVRCRGDLPSSFSRTAHSAEEGVLFREKQNHHESWLNSFLRQVFSLLGGLRGRIRVFGFLSVGLWLRHCPLRRACHYRLVVHYEDQFLSFWTVNIQIIEKVDPVAVAKREVRDGPVRFVRLEQLKRLLGGSGLSDHLNVERVFGGRADYAPNGWMVVDEDKVNVFGRLGCLDRTAGAGEPFDGGNEIVSKAKIKRSGLGVAKGQISLHLRSSNGFPQDSAGGEMPTRQISSVVGVVAFYSQPLRAHAPISLLFRGAFPIRCLWYMALLNHASA